MSEPSGLNELCIEAYTIPLACEYCDTMRNAGYNFAIVICGCAASIRCCMSCPSTCHPTCKRKEEKEQEKEKQI